MHFTQTHIGAIVGYSAAALIAVLHLLFNFPIKKRKVTSSGTVYVLKTSDCYSYFVVFLACAIFVLAFLAQYFDVGTFLRGDGAVSLWRIITIGWGATAAMTAIALVDGGGAAYALFECLFMMLATGAMHLTFMIEFKDTIGPFCLGGFFYLIACGWLLFASKAAVQLRMWCKALGAFLVIGYIVLTGLDGLDLGAISNNICMWAFVALSISICLYAALCHGFKAECTLLKSKLWTKPAQN